jgi:hypothetical protein
MHISPRQLSAHSFADVNAARDAGGQARGISGAAVTVQNRNGNGRDRERDSAETEIGCKDIKSEPVDDEMYGQNSVVHCKSNYFVSFAVFSGLFFICLPWAVCSSPYMALLSPREHAILPELPGLNLINVDEFAMSGVYIPYLNVASFYRV